MADQTTRDLDTGEARTDRATGGAEIHLKTTGAVWVGEVLAQGLDHVHIHIRPGESGALPSWSPGTVLDCSMEAAEGRYFVEGTVIRQEGETAYIRVPAVWRRSERRHSYRVPAGFAVTYRFDQTEGVGACVDIGAGGLRFRATGELPVRSNIEVIFLLPGESMPVHAAATVMYVEPDPAAAGTRDYGVKFSRLQPMDGARIARFSHAASPVAE